MVNAKAWDDLPLQYKQVMETAGAECWHWSMARFDELAPPAMRRLLATGTQLRPYSRDIMNAAYKASQELYAELGEQNPRFRKVWEHWNKHRLDQTQWFRVAEDSMSNFVAELDVPDSRPLMLACSSPIEPAGYWQKTVTPSHPVGVGCIARPTFAPSN